LQGKKRLVKLIIVAKTEKCRKTIERKGRRRNGSIPSSKTTEIGERDIRVQEIKRRALHDSSAGQRDSTRKGLFSKQKRGGSQGARVHGGGENTRGFLLKAET